MKNNNKLIFFGMDKIFKIDIRKGCKPQIIHQIRNTFDAHPVFGQFNSDQSVCIIATNTDALHVTLKGEHRGREVDMDEDCQVGSIQNCSCDDKYFYLMANKKKKMLGYYFVKIGVKNPTGQEGEESDDDEKQETSDKSDTSDTETVDEIKNGFLMQWNNKLDIRDCDVSMFQEKVIHDGKPHKNNYVVLSFKSIGINTYNVIVLDIKTGKPKYWHESFQLWESQVKGFLLSTKYFMILSK